MIMKKECLQRGVEIDLTGPDGNAFSLLGYASRWSFAGMQASGRSKAEILDDMQSKDYDHLVEVMDNEFGHFVTFLM